MKYDQRTFPICYLASRIPEELSVSITFTRSGIVAGTVGVQTLLSVDEGGDEIFETATILFG